MMNRLYCQVKIQEIFLSRIPVLPLFPESAKIKGEFYTLQKARRASFFMEKITSFTIDHIKLQPGVYVSRKDPVGNSVITTFDIRMTSPNRGARDADTAELHTIEHLAATFLSQPQGMRRLQMIY